MANTTEYRICPDSGLQFHKPAETLMKANAVAAVVFLLIGGILALLVTLTRWPAVHLLPADWFYLALTAHGFDVLLAWIIFFEMAVLYFAAGPLLNSRIAAPKLGWFNFGLMTLGAVIPEFGPPKVEGEAAEAGAEKPVRPKRERPAPATEGPVPRAPRTGQERLLPRGPSSRASPRP